MAGAAARRPCPDRRDPPWPNALGDACFAQAGELGGLVAGGRPRGSGGRVRTRRGAPTIGMGYGVDRVATGRVVGAAGSPGEWPFPGASRRTGAGIRAGASDRSRGNDAAESTVAAALGCPSTYIYGLRHPKWDTLRQN
jgi:hypothetical protein